MDPSTEVRHGQIATLAATGMRQREIARRLGCHFNTVYRALKRPEVQGHIEAMQAQVFARTCELLAARLDGAREQAQEVWRRKQEERAGQRARRRAQGQGGTWAREPSYDPHWPIRQALAQRQAETGPEDLHQWVRQQAQVVAQHQAQQGQHRAEALPLTQEPAPEPPSPGVALPREQGPNPAFLEAQARDWWARLEAVHQARLEEVKGWVV